VSRPNPLGALDKHPPRARSIIDALRGRCPPLPVYLFAYDDGHHLIGSV
jgi:hypothetical protein